MFSKGLTLSVVSVILQDEKAATAAALELVKKAEAEKEEFTTRQAAGINRAIFEEKNLRLAVSTISPGFCA